MEILICYVKASRYPFPKPLSKWYYASLAKIKKSHCEFTIDEIQTMALIDLQDVSLAFGGLLLSSLEEKE
jgi:hypothetical protein